MARRKYEIRDRVRMSDGSIYHVNAHTKRERDEKIRKREDKIRAGTAYNKSNPAGRTVLIEQVYETWIDEKRKKTSPRYKQNIKTRMKKHIMPTFGKMTFAEVDSDMIEAFFDDLTSESKKATKGGHKEQFSDSYVKKIKTDFNFLFKCAIKEKYVTRNPLDTISQDEGKKQVNRRPATDEEVDLLRKVADDDSRFMFFLVMAFCGLRNSEVARLKGEDCIEIDDKPFFHVKGTKSVKADRLVPVPLELWLQLPIQGPDDYIFRLTTNHPHRANDYYDSSAQRRLWLECKKQMNIKAGCATHEGHLVPPLPVAEDLTPYCFRHAYATKLHELKVPLDYRKYMLGHAQISTTIDIYTQLGLITAKDLAKSFDFESITNAYK